MSGRASHLLAYCAPLAGYCALVFAISAMTAPPAPDYPFEWGDKINHALAYALMFALAVRAVRALGKEYGTVRSRLLAAFTFCAIYGGTDEIHQLFVVGRSCDVLDWIADLVGAGLAAFVLPHLLRLRPVATLVAADPKAEEALAAGTSRTA